jgi:molybdopterin converting factor small subunit
VTSGKVRSELAADNLRELLEAFVQAHPQAGYRLYSPGGELLRYHIFFVDGEQVYRTTPHDEVVLEPGSTVEVIPPLSGG